MNILNPARAVIALVSFLALLAVSLPGHAVFSSGNYDSEKYSQGPGCFNIKYRTGVKKIRYRNECQFVVVGVFCFMEVGNKVDEKLKIGTCDEGFNFPLPLDVDHKTEKNKYRWKANGEGAVLKSLKGAYSEKGNKLEIANGKKGNLKIPFDSHKVNVVWSVCDVKKFNDETCDFKPASVLYEGRCSKDPNAFGCSDAATLKGGEKLKNPPLTTKPVPVDETNESGPGSEGGGQQPLTSKEGGKSDSAFDGDEKSEEESSSCEVREQVSELLKELPCPVIKGIKWLLDVGDVIKVFTVLGIIIAVLIYFVPPVGRYWRGLRQRLGDAIRGKFD